MPAPGTASRGRAALQVPFSSRDLVPGTTSGPRGSPVWGRAALQVPLSSRDLVTVWGHPGSSRHKFRQHIKKRCYFAKKGPSSQSYGFSRSHIWMFDHKESWAPKNRCFWTVVLEKTLESPLDCKEIQPVNPKGNQYWIFIKRTDAEAEAEAEGHLMWRTDSLEKTLMLQKIEGRRRRGWQRMRWMDGIINSMDMSLSKSGRQWRTGKPGVLQSMGLQRIGHNWATELNSTDANQMLQSNSLNWCLF